MSFRFGRVLTAGLGEVDEPGTLREQAAALATR
jgi:hypothetical protein